MTLLQASSSSSSSSSSLPHRVLLWFLSHFLPNLLPIFLFHLLLTPPAPPPSYSFLRSYSIYPSNFSSLFYAPLPLPHSLFSLRFTPRHLFPLLRCPPPCSLSYLLLSTSSSPSPSCLRPSNSFLPLDPLSPLFCCSSLPRSSLLCLSS